ncbi:MAG: hypothetical protein K2W96_19130 [Gemmataceae bacterium]|nr:hypothetical protein [Gemmataceae bacterium]
MQGVVMLASGLSPQYPLGAALARVRGRMRNFWSPLDLVYLGAGTLLCGTADGRHTVGAGLRGFAGAHGDKLRQVGYEARWAGRFHLGGHFGCVNRVFVAETLAPLLRGEEA